MFVSRAENGILDAAGTPRGSNQIASQGAGVKNQPSSPVDMQQSLLSNLIVLQDLWGQ
jgi:hypothetical protein